VQRQFDKYCQLASLQRAAPQSPPSAQEGVVSATGVAMQQVPPDIQARTIPSREPHRSLPVAPLIGDQRCYGEATVRVWGGSGEASGGGRYVTHYPESSEEPESAPQVPQPQRLKVTSWERHRSASRVPPEQYRLAPRRTRSKRLAARNCPGCPCHLGVPI
jgi:hypothetical protein